MPNTKSAKRLSNVQTPREIHKVLDEHVIGQTAAKKSLAVAAYWHQRSLEMSKPSREGKIPFKKSNVLIVGPTGTGKTLLASTLASVLKVPFTTADATDFTAAGYWGRDVEEILGDLIRAADGKEAEHGVVFIDEIDKIARNDSSGLDVGGVEVQQSLLKMIDSKTARIDTGNDKHERHEKDFNTTNVLFIFGGAFSDMEGEPSTENLIRYGMIPEFVGRIPITTKTHPLTEDDLVSILQNPKDAILKDFQKRMEIDNVKLKFSQPALREIAKEAMTKKTGARGLRTIMERVLLEYLYEAPEMSGRTIEVDARTIQRRLAA